jgi:hypothetical protein
MKLLRGAPLADSPAAADSRSNGPPNRTMASTSHGSHPTNPPTANASSPRHACSRAHTTTTGISPAASHTDSLGRSHATIAMPSATHTRSRSVRSRSQQTRCPAVATAANPASRFGYSSTAKYIGTQPAAATSAAAPPVQPANRAHGR